MTESDCRGCVYCEQMNGRYDGYKCDCIADALALLKEQEAKTGHWIEKEDYNLDTYYDCSVCGESWTMIDGTPWENGMNYCPHCGAKMEGRRMIFKKEVKQSDGSRNNHQRDGD